MNDDNRQYPEWKELLEKYLAGSLTEEESQAFYEMLPHQDDQLAESITADLQSGRFDGQLSAPMREQLFRRLPLHNSRRKTILRRMLQIAAAALVAGVAVMYWPAGRSGEMRPVSKAVVSHAAAGSGKATLTLGDGDIIVLDSADNGMLAHQGAASVTKMRNGMLTYSGDGVSDGEQVYNTITTPKGGVYTVQLPDGSIAWLNAASWIRFPTEFGRIRTVEAGGEVYFEVAKRDGARFEVLFNGSKISVLGTKFNLHAYKDEQATTVTLLEGAVRFSTGADSVLLRPGQQAVAGDGCFRTIPDADLEAVMAWKNGMFHFDNLPLTDIMREISRWYDVDVLYQGNPVVRRFSGIVSRSANIRDVLRFMQLAGVRFEITGRKITVIQ